MTQKEVIGIVKQNETKQIETNNWPQKDDE